ncbi:MAG: fumarylacetoacetate hydrolase family protein [Sporomusaceae bacterium]|nr:fumarylacetoacetate hydrolase family protein [Sporomusaceae bacterium]
MNLYRFSYKGKESWGALEQGMLRVLSGDVVEGDATPSAELVAFADAELLCPVKQPSKIIGVGLNYKSVAAAKGVELPSEPTIFLKPPSSVVGPGQSIVVPSIVKNPAFEVELAVVMGRKAKNVAAGKALDYVFGYTLGNDVTAKDHMIKGQPWTRGKSFDTFTPLGPCIATADSVNPYDVPLIASVNGHIKQSGSTGDMIFDVAALIAFISGIMTLEPGDVILTGTLPGSGEIGIGDVVTLSSLFIGTMENKVVAG